MSYHLRHLWEYILGTGFALWLICFLIFSLSAISFKYIPPETTQAIVVLTGGTDRIKEGIKLLQQHMGQDLFISGVNKSVKQDDLLKGIEDEYLSHIHLGYMADSTLTNALEVSDWIQQKQYTSIILLTSFYHLPRALLEIHHHIPNLTVIPHAVFPKQFNESTYWVHTKYAWQLFLEYHKFLVVYLKYLIQRIII